MERSVDYAELEATVHQSDGHTPFSDPSEAENDHAPPFTRRSPLGRRWSLSTSALPVYPTSVPQGLADEVELLYGSLFATVDWFVTHDDTEPSGACVLEAPRHVLLFCVKGDTIEVLNKAFEIAPRDARRACIALFRAFPRVRRIHLEVMFAPDALHAPLRVRYSTDHMIVELPGTVDECFRLSAGACGGICAARGTISAATTPMRTRSWWSRGRTAAPSSKEFLEWKRARFREKGQSTYWDRDPELARRFVELLRRRGEAHVMSIDGRPATINFIFPVGDTFCAQESWFDPRYGRSDVGLLSQYEVVVDAIERGARRMNLLWGSAEHKRHFGATAHRATALSVFRTQSARLWSMDEALEVGRRRLRKAAHAKYWEARHASQSAALAAHERLTSLRGRAEGSTVSRRSPACPAGTFPPAIDYVLRPLA